MDRTLAEILGSLVERTQLLNNSIARVNELTEYIRKHKLPVPGEPPPPDEAPADEEKKETEG